MAQDMKASLCEEVDMAKGLGNQDKEVVISTKDNTTTT